ncbi:error-prone DNA polymerase [Peptococcaceae bacterium CEB3]|nr:error-prone DNA polymerase [Peptococcaceae bacterium CEB3]
MSVIGDLHTHSLFSDGTDSPRELVRKAKERGLCVLALVDHDTVEGLEEFLTEAKASGLEGIPGVEISTSINRTRIHILGYFIDYREPSLLSFLSKMAKARTENTREILLRLERLDLLHYAWESVLRHNPRKSWICSSDVFLAMMKDGFYSSLDQWPEFYHRYFGKESQAYLDLEGFTPAEAIDIILKAQGIPVLAHPKLVGDDRKIGELVERGLMGIEVHYPVHGRADVENYLHVAEKYDLLVTGGTDWHGELSEWRASLSEFGISEEELERLHARKDAIAVK